MSGFHFTSTAPSAQLISDIESINQIDAAGLTTLTRLLLSYLTSSPSRDDLTTDFLSSNPSWKSRLKPLLTSMLHFFTLTMRSKAGPQQQHIETDLRKMGLNQEYATQLSTSFIQSISELSQVALEKTLHVNQLHDIQWKFGVSASSSELNQMGSCFLQLQMTVEKGENRKENVLMELSLPQFYSFLQQMQLANRQMQAMAK